MSSPLPRGIYQAVDPAKITHWDKTTSLYREGMFDGKQVSRQGVSPHEVMYFTDADANALADGTTDYATMTPGVFNADTLGIQPVEIGRPINNWHELFNEEFRRPGGRHGYPADHDHGRCARHRIDRRVHVRRQGQHDQGRDHDDCGTGLIDLKKKGHWRSMWGTFDQSVQLMTSGEVVIQSMWSPAVTAVRAAGVPCIYQPLAEGYRGWGNGAQPDEPPRGQEAGCGLRLSQLVLRRLDGAPSSQSMGYYLGVSETAKAFMQPFEWDYWYEGKPAADTINDPYGNPMEKAGARPRRRLVLQSLRQHGVLEHADG